MAENTNTTVESKVEFLKHQLPAVNSKEYWAFRTANDNLTHADYTSAFVAKHLPKGATTSDARAKALELLDTPKVAKADIGSTERQMLQYLGQLTLKGWRRFENLTIRQVVERTDS